MKALMLRTCGKDGLSYGDYSWPEVGQFAVAEDWDPRPVCGRGLHGLLWGEGDGNFLDWSPDAIWIVAEIDTAEMVDLGGKVKVPRALVLYRGDREGATRYLRENGGAGREIVGLEDGTGDYGYAVAGDYGVATAGYCGNAVAGERGCARVGDRGTATAGPGGTAIAGNWGMATAGDYGHAIAGHDGVAKVGDRGRAEAGSRGSATAGDGGTAISGFAGTATAGDGGEAKAGAFGVARVGDNGIAIADEFGVAIAGNHSVARVKFGGIAAAGHGGRIEIEYRDGVLLHLKVEFVGKKGIKPNVFYRYDETDKCLVDVQELNNEQVWITK